MIGIFKTNSQSGIPHHSYLSKKFAMVYIYNLNEFLALTNNKFVSILHLIRKTSRNNLQIDPTIFLDTNMFKSQYILDCLNQLSVARKCIFLKRKITYVNKITICVPLM